MLSFVSDFVQRKMREVILNCFSIITVAQITFKNVTEEILLPGFNRMAGEGSINDYMDPISNEIYHWITYNQPHYDYDTFKYSTIQADIYNYRQ